MYKLEFTTNARCEMRDITPELRALVGRTARMAGEAFLPELGCAQSGTFG